MSGRGVRHAPLSLESRYIPHFYERRLRAPALNRFSQKATFRNSPLFLQPALYMVERPRPYTLPLPVPQVCTMPESGDGFQDLSGGSIHVPQGRLLATPLQS
jgi:hypothetical protein